MTLKKSGFWTPERIAVSYYKWEFVRRNTGYRSDYEAFERRFGHWIKKHGRHPDMKDTSDRAVKYYFAKIYPVEAQFFEKWGVLPPTEPVFHVDFKFLKESPILVQQMPVRLIHQQWVLGEAAVGQSAGRLDLSIRLEGPKHEIMEQLEFAIDLAQRDRKRFVQREPKRTRRRLDLYDTYLRVWDLREHGKSFRQIAETIYPDLVRRWDTHPDRGQKYSGNPIVQRVRDHYREACRLIAGGYKEIS